MKDRIVKVQVSGVIEIKVSNCKSDEEAARYVDEVMTTDEILDSGAVETKIVDVTEVETK